MSDGTGRSWWQDYVDHPRHGPLPGLLVLLTVATGLVDAVNILALGRVFGANMTGNVAFLGFALGGAPGFSLDASVVALVAFLGGAGLGGLLVHRRGGHRGRLLRDATVPVLGLLVAAVVVLALAPARTTARRRSASSPSARSPWACRTPRSAASPCRTSRRRC